MLDGDHPPSAPPAEPVRGVTRGLIVGAYDGLRAGKAIVAVRELGLRPSLERVEGYDESLHGFVISQEPAAGTEAAADSQVFLYIASPARTIPASAPSGAAEEALEEEPDGMAHEATEQELPEDEPGGIAHEATEQEPSGEREEREAGERERPLEELLPAEHDPALEDPSPAEHEPPVAEPDTHEAWGDESVEREAPVAAPENHEIWGAESAEPDPPVAEPDTQEAWEDEPAHDREAVEKAPGWRGGPPGALPRRRASRSLPLSLRVAPIALAALAALAVLVSLASSEQSRSPAPPRSHLPAAVKQRHRPAAQPVARPVAQPVAPQDVAPRPAQRRSPHRALSTARVATSAAASPPRRAPLPSRAFGPTESADEHAIREFGP